MRKSERVRAQRKQTQALSWGRRRKWKRTRARSEQGRTERHQRKTERLEKLWTCCQRTGVWQRQWGWGKWGQADGGVGKN